MPELPEVETVRRGLERVAHNATFSPVIVTGRRSVRRQSAQEFAERLSGRTAVSIERWGKYLVTRLDDGAFLVTHLRMSGKLTFATDPSAPTEPHTHIVIGLEGGNEGPGELRFVDPRTFGEMFVSDTAGENDLPIELSKLGIDPVHDALDEHELFEMLNRRRIALKAFLLDQHVIAGIGSIYADEICFVAELRPDRVTNSLDQAAAGRLAAAIPSVLTKAIELGGSSLRDESYRDLFGAIGSYQDHHAAYGRTGKPCVRCETPIVSIRVAGRSAHFCPRCQT